MIAKGGRAFVGLSALAAVALLPFFLVASIAFAALATFLLLMFRDPHRTIGTGVVSPADGTVRDVDKDRGFISIYLALRNVHVTRAPAGGTLGAVTLSPGRHAPAFSRRTLGNERAQLTLNADVGQITVVEMTGAVARRIVLYVRAGQTLSKGQRLGLIRFGSRVDVILPPSATIAVAKGDRVWAGATTIAEVNDGQMG